MAADDILRVKANFEAPSGAAAFTMYYREDSPRSGGVSSPRQLATAWIDKFGSLIKAYLPDDWRFASATVRMVYAELGPAYMEPPWISTVAVQAGDESGPSLPANNAIQLALCQATFPARSNGRVYLPGIPESATDVGQLTQTYLTTNLAPLRDALAQPVDEMPANTGSWGPGVISQKVLNANPPAKDWPAAFAPVVGVVIMPLVATQRRRTSKVVGRSQ